MFLHWSVSLALLILPFIIYRLVISPQWKTSFAESYEHIPGFWDRQLARLWALRSFITASVGMWAAALPDILVQVSALDLSFLPQPWGANIGTAVAVLLLVFRLLAVTPHEQPPK